MEIIMNLSFREYNEEMTYCEQWELFSLDRIDFIFDLFEYSINYDSLIPEVEYQVDYTKVMENVGIIKNRITSLLNGQTTYNPNHDNCAYDAEDYICVLEEIVDKIEEYKNYSNDNCSFIFSYYSC